MPKHEQRPPNPVNSVLWILMSFVLNRHSLDRFHRIPEQWAHYKNLDHVVNIESQVSARRSMAIYEVPLRSAAARQRKVERLAMREVQRRRRL